MYFVFQGVNKITCIQEIPTKSQKKNAFIKSIKSNDMILIMYPRLKITSKIENHISFEILGLIHYYVMHGNSLSIDNDSKTSMTE